MTGFITTIGPWVAVFVTIAFWSYLYKENVLFRFIEFTFVGFATAHATVLAVDSLKSQMFTPLLKNNYILIIPLILGLLFYTRYSTSIRPLSRFPISIMVGVGTGLAVRAMVRTQLLDQIVSTINPTDPYTGIFMAILTICTIFYFVFSSPKNLPKSLLPSYNIIQRIGRISIMVAMGAAFGSLAVTRFTNAITLVLNAVNLILGR
jgi:hypothetical protein